MLHPNQFTINEAWILFRLNSSPIQTGLDGTFNCFALMDAASCFILGSEMVRAEMAEPSKLEARRLLKTANAHKKQWPRTLFLARESDAVECAREAERLGIEVVRVPEAELLVFVGDAQEGFRERFG